MGAAREAGLYGMPAIACSFTSFDLGGMEQGIEGSVQLVERALELLPSTPQNLCRPHTDADSFHVSKWPNSAETRSRKDAMEMLLHAFFHGELMLNINVPPTWNGKYQTTRLGMRWYREAVQFGDDDHEGTVEARFTIGAAYIDTEPVLKGDCDSVEDDFASISSLANWPQTHPLALDDELLSHALEEGADGFPLWLRD
jgi:broad specificity polyphosphatase/5'/3'-nucleotidase SurE